MTALGIVASGHTDTGLVRASTIGHWHTTAPPSALTSDYWVGSAVEWPGAAWQNNGRASSEGRWIYEANVTPHTGERSIFCYATDWIDGATIELLSGTAFKIVEWKRGTDTWRLTTLNTVGATHTINLSDTTSGTIIGPTPAPTPWDNVLLERDDTALGVFSCRVTLVNPVETMPPLTCFATPGDTIIDFSWTGHYPDYEVRIGSGSWVTKGSLLAHQFTGLTNGTPYTCEVRTVSPYGVSTAISASATPGAAGFSPLLAYNFTESGTSVTDRSGNGRTGSMLRVTTPTDLHSSGEFLPTTTGDRVVYTSDSAARPANASVTAKIRMPGTVGRGNVFSKFRSTDSSAFNLYVESSKLRCVVRGSSGVAVILEGAPLSASTTYQVALTYNGTTTRLYVDGVEKASSTSTSGNLDMSGTGDALTWQIGDHNMDTSIALISFGIDDVRFFNYALTLAEVNALAALPVT